MTALRPLATLWIGGPLGFLEVLCLKAMMAQGHDVLLYSYGPVANIPEGVDHRDAQEIFPSDFILVHERTKTPSAHSDIFRLNLMKKTTAIWVDLDFRPSLLRCNCAWMLLMRSCRKSARHPLKIRSVHRPLAPRFQRSH